MFGLIERLMAEMEHSTQLLIKKSALDNENSAEITALINAVCAEFKLDKYNKGIHRIVKRNVANVKLKKPKRETRRVTSFNVLAGV